MHNKGIILSVGDNYLERYSFVWKPFKSAIKKFRYNFNLINNDEIELRCKKTCVLIENEEIDIKRLRLPYTKEKILHDLVRNELSYYYRKIDDVVFRFIINKKIQSNVDIVVFCLNSSKLRLAEKYISKNTLINKVYLIQFCFLKYFKKKFKVENYIFMFKYNNCIYFLCCVNSVLIFNSLLKVDRSGEELNQELHNFIEKTKIYTDSSISTIYYANFSTTDFSPEINKELTFEDLGSVNDKRFIKNIKKGR